MGAFASELSSGLFIGVSGGTNSGKTYSALRLARGLAGPKGRIDVIDCEGGRTLHLRDEFVFVPHIMEPPYRPARFREAITEVLALRPDVILIDSFTMEWAGIGGVLEWFDELFLAAGGKESARQRCWIEPKRGHKALVGSMLQIKGVPIIFSMRATEKFDTKIKDDAGQPKRWWQAVQNSQFPFELTVSFMLEAGRNGIIDLESTTSTGRPLFKMERAHRAIFKHGEQLSEEHGAKLGDWWRGRNVADPVAAAVEKAVAYLAGLAPGPDAAAAAGNRTAALVAKLKETGRDAELARIETEIKRISA